MKERSNSIHMKANFSVLFVVMLSVILASCSNKKEKKDDILAGKLPVIVDEAILPLFLEQKEVFESSYYNAKIEDIAKPEITAINALLNGDASFAVLTRQLTEEENKGFKQRSITPKVFSLGYDGIVAVANVEDQDTAITVNEVVGLMKGNKIKSYSLVFDNLNSSIFRYLRELGEIDKVASTFVGAKGTAVAVLEEVAQSRGKIGFIGYNQYLSLESSFSGKDKIRILSVLNDKLDLPRYVKPSQSSLATDEYPLKREIFVLNYQPNLGLGIGFSAFMTGDRGQRIVLKSGLLPYTMPGREIIIRDKIN